MNISTQIRFRNIAVLAIVLSGIWTNPVIAQDTPPERCAGLGEIESHFLTTWENGLEDWSPGVHDVANESTFDTPDWDTTGNLPGAVPGMAAFVPNLNIGDCEADDESGALNLDSPVIQLPQDVEVIRLSLSHFIETEYLYDGGNLKISVNGGAFELIPATAIEYGSYNGTLVPIEQGNSNPLASEPAFTGTEGDEFTGKWGESHINLSGIADPGDSVRLRLGFGIDGCGGETGWYVDTTEIYSCTEELAASDCGNGAIDAGEQCDDGNGFNDDGCSNTCQVEEGWTCTMPVPPGVIDDPSFEAGTPNPFWTESSTTWGTPICGSGCGTSTGSGPLDGEYWAWFGGTAAYEEGRLSQLINIPAGLETLTFGLEASRCGPAEDYIEVLIDGIRRLEVDGTSQLCNAVGYTILEVDISPYADGNNHTLEFHSEVFATDGQQSLFFVDVVNLLPKPSVCTLESDPTTSLTLVKQVINDNGGTAQASDWTLTATGPSTFSGSGPSVTSSTDLEAGTYELSESGGPGGYTASDWQCAGGEMTGGSTVVVNSDTQVTCTVINDDSPQTSAGINVGHAGAWYNPQTSGQGVLIDIEPGSQFMFLAWFTYTEADSEHPFEHNWLTAQGNFDGDSANLVISKTTGGAFDEPQEVETVPVGNATVTFSDCVNGTMSYAFDDSGLQGSFPITRVIPGSEDTCEQSGAQNTQAVDINSGMDGAWFNSATSGQGLLIDAYPAGEFIFVAWFTYGNDTASGLRWLTAQGSTSGSLADLILYSTTDGSFDDPKEPTTLPVGSMSIDFTDCANASVMYSLPDENLEGDISVTRVIPGSETLCESLN